jgi:aspartyl-tRNA(Asn)/glutamyl-tRNA(Gln) amidotransferase subunit A
LKKHLKNMTFCLDQLARRTAFKIGEKASDPLQMYLTDIMTVAANISGNPAISVPAGKAKTSQLGCN